MNVKEFLHQQELSGVSPQYLSVKKIHRYLLMSSADPFFFLLLFYNKPKKKNYESERKRKEEKKIQKTRDKWKNDASYSVLS
jgi:hypothetical protein